MQIKNKRKLYLCFTLVLIALCALAFAVSAAVVAFTLSASSDSITFNAVDGADYYIVRAYSRGTVISVDNGTSLTAVPAVAGQSVYTVNYTDFAKYSDLKTMLSSGPVTFCVFAYKNAVRQNLAKPVLSLSGDVVSWNSVEYATHYFIKITSVSSGEDVVYKPLTGVTSYDLSSLSVGKYTISVSAVPTDDNYLASGFCTPIDFIKTPPKLSAPVISLSNSRIVWSAVPNATSYSVSFLNPSGNPVCSRDTTSLNLLVGNAHPAAVTSPGNYTIKVTASADGYLTSDYSNALDCTVKSSLAPVLSVSGYTVSWTAVANTSGYTVYYSKDGGEEVGDILNSDVLSYDFSSLADGTYTVKVIANGGITEETPLIYYSMSEYSNTVQFTKTSTASGAGYYITFANVAYDYNYISNVYIQIDGTGDWITVANDGELLEYDDVHFFYIYYSTEAPAVHMALLNNDGGYPDMEDASLSQYNITNSVSVATATKVVISEQCDIVVTVFENG